MIHFQKNAILKIYIKKSSIETYIPTMVMVAYT